MMSVEVGSTVERLNPTMVQADAGVVCPFPADLVLTPCRASPTRLPDPTVRRVLAAPLPRRCVDPKPHATVARISIVIVTFNNLVFNRLCLESVLAYSEGCNYEVIVVDNGSEDGTREYLRELARSFPNLRILFNQSNLGFAAATNQGLTCAAGELLILLNNDTIVPHGWHRRLVKHLKDPAVGLVGPVTNRAGNEAEIDTSYRTWSQLTHFAEDYMCDHEGMRFDIRTATMFCTALRRDVYECVGPLDEQL